MKIKIEQIPEILELYKTKSQKEISLIYNVSQSNIAKILKKNNAAKESKGRLNMSKLAVDIDYFENINTPEKAYWLGYLAADGCINKVGGKTGLVSKDFEIIQKFKKDIGSSHKITTLNVKDKRTNKVYCSYVIQITNHVFTQNLIKLGVGNNKTNIFNFPDIEEKYYSYFIAGLFDGDGSVCYRNENKFLRISLISTFEVLSFIQNYLVINLGIKKIKMFSVSENKHNVWKMHLYKDAFNFLKFIYQDGNFDYMHRKYKIFKTYENYFS